MRVPSQTVLITNELDNILKGFSPMPGTRKKQRKLTRHMNHYYCDI